MQENEKKELLHAGKWGNADVWRISDHSGAWILKDFSARSWFVRKLWAPFIVRREFAVLTALDGLEGVPHSPELLNHGVAIRYREIPGEDLGTWKNRQERIPSHFFHELELLLFRIHETGYVHLDLRRAGNIIITPNGKPGIIDFQSAIKISRFPAALQKLLKAIDYSGVYKNWQKYATAAPGKIRTQIVVNLARIRKYWFLRGYPLRKRRKHRKRH